MRDERLACVGREEEEIAPLQPTARRVTESRLVDGATGKMDAEFLIHVLREARAVECIRTFGTPNIWAADQPGREINRILRERAGGEEKAHEYRVRNSANHESPGYRGGRRRRQHARGKRNANRRVIYCGKTLTIVRVAIY